MARFESGPSGEAPVASSAAASGASGSVPAGLLVPVVLRPEAQAEAFTVRPGFGVEYAPGSTESGTLGATDGVGAEAVGLERGAAGIDDGPSTFGARGAAGLTDSSVPAAGSRFEGVAA